MTRSRIIPALTAAATLLLTGLTAPAAMAADAKPVDVFIGDSSAVNGSYSDGTTALERWTRLFSDADGADEINVAVAGSGFVVGGANTFDKQADKAVKLTQGRTVRRVFVIGVGNDMSAADKGTITSAQLTTAITSTMPKIAAAYPNAQKLYVPEASPMTAHMKTAYQNMKPYMGQIYTGVKFLGFTSKEDWNTLVDGNGTSKDGTHLNRKGNNLMAHAMQAWVNTLGDPRNTGTIPAWRDDTTTTDTIMLDAATFPDKTLRDWLKATYDKDGDSRVNAAKTQPALDSFTSPELDKVRDYTGMDRFPGYHLVLNKPTLVTNLPDTSGTSDLSITDASSLSSLDLSRMHAGDIRILNATTLTTFTPPKNRANLTYLRVDDALKATRPLDLSGASKLETVLLDDTGFTNIDLSGAESLKTFQTAFDSYDHDGTPTPGHGTVNLSDSDGLETVHVDTSSDGTDITLPPALPKLTHLHLRTGGDLSALAARIPSYTTLTDLELDNAKITKLDVSKLGRLDTLRVGGTSITQLDLTHNPKLTRLGVPKHAYAVNGLDSNEYDISDLETDPADRSDVSSLDLSAVAPLFDPSRATMINGTLDGTTVTGDDHGDVNYEYRVGGGQRGVVNVRFRLKPKTGTPQPATHTVTFDSANGSKVDAQTVDDGMPVVKPADPTRDGYTFSGWTLDGKAYDFTQPVSKDLTLTAAWSKTEAPTPVTHTVTFQSNGGPTLAPQSVEDGKTAVKPTDPTRDGYRFDGWTLDGKAYDFATPVTRDITLAANWTRTDAKPITHTVSFDAGDGTPIGAQSVEDGHTVVSPADPKRDGYRFDGWLLDGKPYDFATPVIADITLTAAWSKTASTTGTPTTTESLPVTGASVAWAYVIAGLLATIGIIGLVIAQRNSK